MSTYNLNWIKFNNSVSGRCLVELPDGTKLMEWQFNGRRWATWKRTTDAKLKQMRHAINYSANPVFAKW